MVSIKLHETPVLFIFMACEWRCEYSAVYVGFSGCKDRPKPVQVREGCWYITWRVRSHCPVFESPAVSSVVSLVGKMLLPLWSCSHTETHPLGGGGSPVLLSLLVSLWPQVPLVTMSKVTVTLLTWAQWWPGGLEPKLVRERTVLKPVLYLA